MALAAAGGVEDRPEAVGDCFGSGEFFDGRVEVALVGGNHRRVGRVRQRVLVRAELLGEAVGRDVEPGGRIDGTALRQDSWRTRERRQEDDGG